jgi:transcriptional antiterminator RfaH
MGGMLALSWYVARTKPLAEYVAKDCLEAAGVEIYLPCVPTTRPRPGRSDEPLFPGYLFLRYDLEQPVWPRLLFRDTNLVGLVACAGVAAPVDDTVITELAHRVEAVNRSGEFRSQIRDGDRVLVRLGSVEERLMGVVTESTQESARVKVLLEFLGLQVPAEVPRGDVQPVLGPETGATKSGKPPRRTRGRGRWVRGFGPRDGEAD